MMIDDATLQNALDACPTPLYLFDHQVLNDRITRLRASLPSRIKLCYAMKANPFIVLEASALADCVEACSPGEVLICANAGVPFEKIVLSGVWKDRRCLDDLFQADRIPHRFTIESSQQLKDLVVLANAYRRRVKRSFQTEQRKPIRRRLRHAERADCRLQRRPVHQHPGYPVLLGHAEKRRSRSLIES